MPAPCPHCGASHPDDFLFCPKTGTPLRAEGAPAAPAAPARWEYRDLEIPIDLRALPRPAGAGGPRPGALLSEDERRFDQRVLAFLQQVGRDGWEPVDPTDFRSLDGSGRVTYRPPRDAPEGGEWQCVSATVRLKRLLRA
jgi:hypothetical protein